MNFARIDPCESGARYVIAPNKIFEIYKCAGEVAGFAREFVQLQKISTLQIDINKSAYGNLGLNFLQNGSNFSNFVWRNI